MRRAALAVVAILAVVAGRADADVSAVLSVQVVPPPPMDIEFAVSAPTVDCSAAPGTVVSGFTVSAGDGNPITTSLSGDTVDFAIDSTGPTGNVVVGQNGITAPDCPATGMTLTEVVTLNAMQQ